MPAELPYTEGAKALVDEYGKSFTLDDDPGRYCIWPGMPRAIWGAPFTERMIEFARGHRGVKRVLGDLVAGEQGYVDLKKKLVKSAFRPV